MQPHVHPVQIYYEDTDHSGFVYHANYLKYFERAREHLLGVAELVRLWRDDRVGFVVYRAELTFREPAVFGDTVEVHTSVALESEYRLVFQQDARRAVTGELLVKGAVQLVCVDGAKRLVPVPGVVVRRLVELGGA